jgi:hypothetical protein
MIILVLIFLEMVNNIKQGYFWARPVDPILSVTTLRNKTVESLILSGGYDRISLNHNERKYKYGSQPRGTKRRSSICS